MGQFWCCGKGSDAPLQIQIGNSEDQTSNQIKTTNYNIITFIPLATLYQFKRLANVYFLIIAIMTFFPQISPFTPISGIGPLLFVLAMSLVREGIQQFGRYKYDRECNSAEFEIFEDSEWVKKRSDFLKVGHIIKIYNNERLPADILVLATSNNDGKCYIETGSLDGQKNLKNKLVLKKTQQLFSSYPTKKKIKIHPFLILGEPTQQLYIFNGQINYDFSMNDTQYLKLSQFLYRDSVLKNTDYIIGVIVYTGKHTKSILNNGRSRFKMSQVEKKVNFYMIFIFISQILLFIGCGIVRVLVFYNTSQGKAFEKFIGVGRNYNYVVEGIVTATTYFLLFNTMIPISLLVTIELVKFGQGIFINADKLMTKNDISPRAFRSSINEELGIVEYVFTDKTGTLTKNQMILEKLFICEKQFLNEAFEVGQGRQFVNQQITFNSYHDLTYLSKLAKEGQIQKNQKFYNSLMLLMMSTCHECVLNPDLTYHGSSPDQITLVASASANGFKFKENSLQKYIVEINKQIQTFDLQFIFQFDSDRKRMSVLLGHKFLGGKRILFTKGADNIIEKRVSTANRKALIQNKKNVDKFSRQGYRTLMFAYRLIDQKQFAQFKKNYNNASQAEKSQLVNQLEKNLTIIGSSAVEDKLQDDVADVIKDLVRASKYISNLDIKVCMLTGDKLQTAENIAYSCGLFDDKLKVFKITEKQPQKQIFEAYTQLQSAQRCGLLVEGAALPSILNCLYFHKAFKKCQTIVCCRITPKNKAEMVNFAKKKLSKMCLSIGDGANDVPMIMAANIGIGVYGKEGMNAVQASDFALPQFKCLWRLLFVHGRWNYLRISDLIKYFFYKNILFTLCQLWYSYFCAFTGTTIFQSLYVTMFNTIFTGAPVLVRALIEQDLNYIEIIKDEANNSSSTLSPNQPPPSETRNRDKNRPRHLQHQLLKSKISVNQPLQYLFPLLYTHTQQQLAFTPSKFILAIAQAVIQSAAVSTLVYFASQSEDYITFSITLYTAVLILVTIKIGYDVTYWTLFLALIFIITVIVPYVLFVFVTSQLDVIWDLKGAFINIVKNITFWQVLLLSVAVSAAIQGFFSVIAKYYFPTITDFVRKQAKALSAQAQLYQSPLNESNLNKFQRYQQVQLKQITKNLISKQN